MASADDCIFCQIVQKKIPSNIVYEDANFVAFLDIRPANKGHTLVVPKNHIADLFALSEEQVKELFATVRLVAQGIKRAIHSDAFNIIQNNGASAGQVIPHVHIHIIPRSENDGLNLGVFRQGKYEGNEISTIRDAIKAEIPEKQIKEVEEPKEEKKVETKERSAEETASIRKEIEIA
jgi:histidine triad (HIT) family protein